MNNTKQTKNRFSSALRTVRRARGLRQEAFSLNSRRTYLRTLGRGLKAPTLNKVDELSQVLNCHPLTVLTLAYLTSYDSQTAAVLLARVTEEIDALGEKWC